MDVRLAVQWTPEAEARFKEIPFFRPAARKKSEKLARELGIQQMVAVSGQATQHLGS
ncbi:MAG TPA: PCP reductase family protein [Synechococcus sp. M44_DOE_062]|nr:PCP reductase family protein [Synechococcus sp. M44_DOE_062]